MDHLVPSDVLLARYLAGECSAAEIRDIEQWAELSAVNRARLDQLRAVWTARVPESGRKWDVEGIWARVRPARRAFGVTLQATPHRRASALAAAAILVVLLGGAAVMLKWTHPAPPMREYVTGRGQRITMQLADGSQLILAPQSRLQIPAEFAPGRQAREVVLNGEAFFTVTHDAQHPFRVRTGSAVVEDIGTRFDLRAYPEDSTVSVAVADGAVALGRAKAEGVVVRAGEVGTLAPNGLVATRDGGSLAEFLSWTDGRLHFTNAPLPDVLQTLGRWYDLDVRLQGTGLSTRTITADLTLRSPDDMLAALALAVDARLTRSGPGGRIVTLTR